MICPICEQEKDNVAEYPDHYAIAIYGEEEATIECCSDCEENNREAI
jgi:hypothetical protein